jgi:DNA-binding GntR family transcriptional regulator
MSVIRADPVRLQVAAKIREAITDLRFRPGQILVERELCEATRASRASVREALRQLESEGLVHSVPGKGTSVAGVSMVQARDLYEMRGVLESMAARLFAERADDTQRRSLVELADRLHALTSSTLEFMAAKNDFYEVLFAGSGNGELHRMVKTLLLRITMLRATSLSVPGRLQRSAQEIEEIARRAAEGDSVAAAALSLRHVETAAQAAFSVYEPG